MCSTLATLVRTGHRSLCLHAYIETMSPAAPRVLPDSLNCITR